MPTSFPGVLSLYRTKLYDSSTGELLPTVASHPTQLYEALSYLLIFAILFIFYRKSNMKVVMDLFSEYL